MFNRIKKCQVVIIGAGPVGLLTAFALKQQGINVRILESLPSKTEIDKTQARAITLSCRALEALASYGLLDAFIDNGQVCRGLNRFLSGNEIAKNDFLALDQAMIETPYFLHIAQWRMQEIIAEALHALGCSIEWNVQFEGVRQQDDSVQVQVNHNGRSEAIHCEYLIGCDGTRSEVRKALDIPIILGVEPFISFRLIDAKIKPFDHDITHRFFHFLDDMVISILPLYDDYQRIVLFELRDADKPEMSTDVFQQALHRAGMNEAVIQEPLWFSEFQPISGVAEHYQQLRVFLLGDAAHPISAITGQGVNTGFQDTYNFSWKLSMVLNGMADPNILNSYHEERYHAGLQLVDRAKRLSNFFGDYFAGGLKRFRAKRFYQSDVFFNHYLLEQSQLDVSYPLGTLIQDCNSIDPEYLQRLQPGMTMPNVQLLSKQGRQALYQLAQENRYLLLLFSANASPNIIQPMKQLTNTIAHQFDHIIDTVCLLNSTLSPSQFDPDQGWPDHIFIDADRVQHQLKINHPCFILLRPDHFIAAMGSMEHASAERTIRKAVELFPPTRHCQNKKAA